METRKKKSGYLSSDWNTLRPNTIWISKKYTNSGNCIIAVRIWDGLKMKPFRAGHPLDRVHPLTIIAYQEQNTHLKLNTKRVYEFLKQNQADGKIYRENFTFGKSLPTDGFRVVTNDLYLFANIKDYPITIDYVGDVA